jgi:hypothetical protein
MDPVGAVVVPPPYLPFMDGPEPRGPEAFRWRLGLRPLDLDDWIELGPDAEAAIDAKPLLMDRHPDTVFAVLDDRVEREGAEVADTLLAHLRRRWPERYGDVELDTGLHPLDAAARLVPEDLVLLVRRDGRTVFGGGSVCFPNRWDLRSKLGLTLDAVHAPVARLNGQLAGPIEAVIDRLVPERSFWRLGWGLLDTPDWYTPVDGTASARPSVAGVGGHVLRVERETLRRLPDTGCVLFTIRTHVTPVEWIRDEHAERLAAALSSLPADVRRYKGLAEHADHLADLLRDAVDNPSS